MYADWFDLEFMPSIYTYFLENREDEDGNEKPAFISEKQFGLIKRNSVQESDGVYTHNWKGFRVVAKELISKKGRTYYTVEFVDNFMENHIKSSEYVINRILELRDSGNPDLSDYAKAFYDTYMSLLNVTELDMVSDIGFFDREHAKKLNNHYVKTLSLIAKIMQSTEPEGE